MFASKNLTARQLNALVKKLGGEEQVRKILSGDTYVEFVDPEDRPKPEEVAIEELDLFFKAGSILSALKCETVKDIQALSSDDLLRFKNFGRRSLEKVVDALELKGFDHNLD